MLDVNDKKVLNTFVLHRDPHGGPSCVVMEGISNARDMAAFKAVSAAGITVTVLQVLVWGDTADKACGLGTQCRC